MVESSGLLNRRTSNRTQGSNPCVSDRDTNYPQNNHNLKLHPQGVERSSEKAIVATKDVRLTRVDNGSAEAGRANRREGGR